MNALLLAAGFGTRMGELSKRIAKPLLPISDIPIAEYLVRKLKSTGRFKAIYVISNGLYYEQFSDWLNKFDHHDISLLNDGAIDNENRLGAIADLKYAVEQKGIEGPLLVLAGDNLFDFDLNDLIDFYDEKKATVVAAYHQTDIEKLRKTGVASINEESRITGFQEKPAEPDDEYAVPCLYMFDESAMKLISEYIEEGNNADAPGNFINWLYKRQPVFAFKFDSDLYSIGDVESYARTRKILEVR